MAKMLYTVETYKGAGLEELEHALHDEFPAFFVYEWTAADQVSAVVVSNASAEAPPVEAWNRLDGWGNGNLTLELVK